MQTDYPFDRPGIYEICIIGKLDERWSERLGGLAISVRRSDESGDWLTVLRGWLPDQVALNGVLNALYDRQFTLRHVTLVREEGSPSIGQLS